MALRWDSVVVDCADAVRVAEFWGEALGLPVQGPSGEEPPVWWLVPGGDCPALLFLRVPEPKSVKNRLHLDLRPDDQGLEVARLEGLGARRVDIGQGKVRWVVMADPEGNEFCVLAARSA